MRTSWRTSLRKTLSVVLSLAVVATTTVTLTCLDGFAQSGSPPAPPKLDANTLDTVVARIALYPDPLLAQVLAAASFSDQIPDAYEWVQAHSTVKGDALVQAMESANLPYDPSVQALIPFPTVMKQLNDDPTWAATLGGAVLTQRGDVMDAVQRMRKKAHDAGNLKTTQQAKVIVESSPQVIEIQPANPQVVYVPVYNPQVVYVAAPPPPPGPSTGTVVAAALIGFAAGVAITAAFSDGWWGYHGGFGWSSHTVVVCNSAWGQPLIKQDGKWHFDGPAGVEEIRYRQIGKNELAAIDACSGYVEAQFDYFSSDWNGDGILQFAQHIFSAPGKKDGLYWSNANDEPLSPLGPFFAVAGIAAGEERKPLSGYYYKILTRQGDAAKGGARNCVEDGRMILGFALVAWPADYGNTGVYTFIVNQLGVVYQKDLGAETVKTAPAIEQFNPDNSWHPVPDDTE